MSEHNLHLKLSTWVTLKKGNGFAEEKISKLPAIIPSSTCGKVATLQSTATFREFRPQDRKSATVKKTGPVGCVTSVPVTKGDKSAESCHPRPGPVFLTILDIDTKT